MGTQEPEQARELSYIQDLQQLQQIGEFQEMDNYIQVLVRKTLEQLQLLGDHLQIQKLGQCLERSLLVLQEQEGQQQLMQQGPLEPDASFALQVTLLGRAVHSLLWSYQQIVEMPELHLILVFQRRVP